MTMGALCLATRVAISGSDNIDTSFAMLAPSERAMSATFALRVSMLIGMSQRCLREEITGNTRSSSSSAGTGRASG